MNRRICFIVYNCNLLHKITKVSNVKLNIYRKKNVSHVAYKKAAKTNTRDHSACMRENSCLLKTNTRTVM